MLIDPSAADFGEAVLVAADFETSMFQENYMNPTQYRSFIVFLVIITLGVLTWTVLNMPDQRTTGQRVGDAIDALPQGPNKAVRQLEDRTPGERLGDTVKDAGDGIQRNTGNNE